MTNIFQQIPDDLTQEHFSDLISSPNIRIERIISLNHSSPESGWYDQEEHEWVIVLEGSGTIEYEGGREVTLNKGDYLNIPAHTKHRVSRTESDEITVWLAVFYS